MKRVIIATTLSLALAGTSLQSAAAADKDPKIGTRVTITGCLHEGKGHDSYVLLGVTERPADTPSPKVLLVPYAIYWLDSTDGLKPYVGEIVDVTGKITARRTDAGTITVSIDPTEHKQTEVEVTAKDKEETTRKFDNTDKPRPADVEHTESQVQVRRPVYKLDVQSVAASGAPVAGPACR